MLGALGESFGGSAWLYMEKSCVFVAVSTRYTYISCPPFRSCQPGCAKTLKQAYTRLTAHAGHPMSTACSCFCFHDHILTWINSESIAFWFSCIRCPANTHASYDVEWSLRRNPLLQVHVWNAEMTLKFETPHDKIQHVSKPSSQRCMVSIC